MYSKEIVKQLHSSVPKEILTVIASEEMFALLDAAQDEHNLSTKQRNMVEYELTMNLLGLTPKNKLNERLSQQAYINISVAEKIIAQFTETIKPQIPEKLLKAQEDYAQAKLKEFLETPQPLPSSPSEETFLPEQTTSEKPQEVVPQVFVPPVTFSEPEIAAPAEEILIPEHTTAHTTPINLPTEGTLPEFGPQIAEVEEKPEEKAEETTVPTFEIKEEPKATDIRYTGGVDPYREPIE
jgi:hypothetical protein